MRTAIITAIGLLVIALMAAAYGTIEPADPLPYAQQDDGYVERIPK